MNESRSPRASWIFWTLAVLAFLVLACTTVDLWLARRLYEPGQGWRFGEHPSVLGFYTYGPVPGAILAVGALLALLLHRWLPKERRNAALALILCGTYLLGPGLLVNIVLKPSWGRSRPRNLVEFGGPDENFECVFSLNQQGMRTSFPSGHAASAFYLSAPYFPLRRRRPRLARGFLIAGTLYGLAMGFSRMLMGAHFLSDVVASGLITAGVAAALTWLLERRSRAKDSPR